MKCFLSHSSFQKMYVEIVANKLGDRGFYDKYDFDAGMDTLDEILRTLEASDVFVLFLSENALESEWVKKEITQAKGDFDSGSLKKIFPIIIDSSINHDDKRIPKWMRENYNLRYISRPIIAVRRIEQLMRGLSLFLHSNLRKKRELFVGRNKLLGDFEARIDDFSLPLPSTVIASGLNDIGRKSFLLNAMKKADIIRADYNPINLLLKSEDGIEGFIVKLIDFGFCDNSAVGFNLLEKSQEEKINIAFDIISEIILQRDVILIDDNRSIVRRGGEIAPWFLELNKRIDSNRIIFCLASNFRAYAHLYRDNTDIFLQHIPELDPSERLGLLSRYIREVAEIDEIEPDDIGYFSGVLNGFPEQSIYAASLIVEHGIAIAKDKAPEVREYSNSKAAVILNSIGENSQEYELIKFLSWFDFISWDLLKNIEISLGVSLVNDVNKLIESSVCELTGTIGEYIRLNDVIRDYASRNNLEMNSNYKSALVEFSKDVIKGNSYDQYDVSETFSAIKIALESGERVPEKLLVPGHFLTAIADKYSTAQYKEVIELCDAILSRSNYDEYIEFQIRYFLCQALARRRDDRFLKEVQDISGPEHNYLFGFYYRKKGFFDKALERLNKSKLEGRTAERSKREIVMILNITEDYDSAYELAKESSIKYKNNPFILQSYFEVLFNMSKNNEYYEDLKVLIEETSRIKGDKADEIYLQMKAKFSMYVENDPESAMIEIKEAVAKYPNSVHLHLTEIGFLISQQTKDELIEKVKFFKSSDFSIELIRAAVKKAEIVISALEGNRAKAQRMIDAELNFINPKAIAKFRSKVHQIN